jgi:hypothetical protein
MSDTNTNAPQDQQGASNATTGTNASLVNELRAFGTQIEAVARAFLASNQAQQIQQRVATGWLAN